MAINAPRPLAKLPASASTPVIGVIYNPHSHRNRGRDLEMAGKSNVHIEQPRERADITAALARLAARRIDYLVINGGDGTVRDVLTCGHSVFAGRWPVLAVLPKGKTNALNVDLGAPAGWNLAAAVDAYPAGRRIVRRPVCVTPMANGTPAGPPMLGFIMGGGAFTLGVQAGQDAHRMGAFDSLAVGATTVWGMLGGLFGSDTNAWRRGETMQFRLEENRRELPYEGAGDPARRSLFLASTLERFPAGMKLFAPGDEGLKLMVLDFAKRRIFGFIPVILAGWVPRWVRRQGFHQLATDVFELTIGGDYILDGEAYPAGTYRVTAGPELSFLVP